MKFRKRLLAAVLGMAASGILIPGAKALVSLEDGSDHVFVTGTFGVSYDSNVFANSQSGGSLTYSEGIAVEIERRAGWIGVNGSIDVESTQLAEYPSQNSTDPKFSLELTKQSGRTTGAFTLLAQKTDKADIDANTRDSSWTYDAGLNLHYPVIERYSFAGTLDYTYVDYLNDKQVLKNLGTTMAEVDLYYILSDERDLFCTYRWRDSDQGEGTYDIDDAFLVGVNGHIYGKLNGSVRVGYEVRTPHGDGTGTYPDLTASGSLTWAIDRKSNLTGQLSRDFATVSTGASSLQTTAGVNYTYTPTAKLSFSTGISAAESRFLGVQGLTPSGVQRVDHQLSVNFGANYTFNQHLKVFLGYTRSQNWSTFAFAQYPSSVWNLSLSSRW